MSPNVAASVHQRLLNLAHAEGHSFNALLQHYALERFLYRLGLSPYAERFVLKGALMFKVWQGRFSRPTRDIDLLGQLDNSVETITSVMKALCKQAVPVQDGLDFLADTVQSAVITEAAQYTGVRSQFLATLGRSKIRMTIDVGFGDAVVPDPIVVHFPTLLEFPPPVIHGYSRESAIAEKLQAMVYLGTINSRMKDFYDIWSLAIHSDFDGQTLAQAIRETFRRRQTALHPPIPALTQAFADQSDKQAQWRAFVRRHALSDDAPAFESALERLRAFLVPVVETLAAGNVFDRYWPPGSPWQSASQ
ncbi:MAG: nucleotidyl transferase AbiEii/AbiGii toxin family protein [Anaerolineae bacterium]|nr:nucleotidyl transferase AbiEii/AbiGii toxin family protein [Anaerolineae bacterium]